MQENYLLSEIRRVRAYYYNKQGVKTYQNLLNRDFNCSSANQKWGTDISYIKTKKGNVYLSVIKDLYDNFIVAYKISNTPNQQLVSQTINKAKNNVAKNLILHIDRGCQYTSLEYNIAYYNDYLLLHLCQEMEILWITLLSKTSLVY